MTEPSHDRRKFGERLHLIRRRRGMTLKALAMQAGTSYATVSRLERGEKPQVSLDVAYRLAEVLGVSLDYLLGRKEDEEVETDALATVG